MIEKEREREKGGKGERERERMTWEEGASEFSSEVEGHRSWNVADGDVFWQFLQFCLLKTHKFAASEERRNTQKERMSDCVHSGGDGS